jgi:hypothetical protein
MENRRTRVASMCIACAAGAIALAGCVPSAYLYDDPPPAYYGGGNGYYPPPTGYYAYPGYYGPVHAPPRIVYVDHGHRGDDCRHESHRDQRPHHDRDRQDHGAGAHDGREEREPQGEGGMSPRADDAPPARDPCAGRKCGLPGAPPEVRAPREPQRPAHRRLDSSPDSQRDVD